MSPYPSPAADRSVAVVHRPGAAVLAGIARVAAQMARADGQADATEQQALLRFLREHDLLRHYGRQTCLDAYRDALAKEAAPAVPARELGAVAAPLLASAAASIALADGTVHPAELSLLGQLAERLCVLGEADAVVSLLLRPQ